ncbi:hypothetical protein [Neobacillus mesonae]|uniref:hypothetical protein n=1 Tax=Neobacillus mesonae TaxID=1193713 RepID=UPI00203B2D0B|nr:hypothetical protein [Neobacillus mesonae]MCM3570512.1 hypothetical protein [Neobacillus mesonae]
MKKLVCRKCGNDQFYVLHVNETLCKCGARLTKLSDYYAERPSFWEKHFSLEQERQAEMIARVSLLKWEIDKCLDEHDEDGFKKAANELKECQDFLHNSKARLKKRVYDMNGKIIT